jgi:hypothetical protein
VVGGCVLFYVLKLGWKAYTHPAHTLGRQAANMDWIADGREDDNGYKNVRYRRGAMTAIVPFRDPHVILRTDGDEIEFQNFVELERWVGQQENSPEDSNEQLDVQPVLFDPDFDFFSLSGEIEIVLTEMREQLEREDKEPLMFNLLRRCSQSLFSAYFHAEQRGQSLWSLDVRFRDAAIRDLVDRFGFTLYMIADRFGEDLDWDADLHNTQDTYTSFQASLHAASSHAIKEVLGSDYDIGPMEFYEDYDYFDDVTYDFWERNSSAMKEIFTLRQSTSHSKRHFWYGFDQREEGDIDDGGDIDASFADYAHIQKVVEKSGVDNVDIDKFLGDTKFEYTPLFVRAFFELTVDYSELENVQ